MTWADRYFNVFFAYRGAGDFQLSSGKQLEDNLTRALAVTLIRSSATTARAFCAEVAAEDPGAPGTARVVLQPTPLSFESSASRRVLLGLSPSGRVSGHRAEVGEGGSRPDAAVVVGDVLLVIESKVVLDLDADQLTRHATQFGLGEPRVTTSGLRLPGSWRLRRWQGVVEWARRAAKTERDPAAAFLLHELAGYLELAGVTSARVRIGSTVEQRPAVEWPEWMHELAVAAPLDAVARSCARLYGDPASPWFVSGDGAPSDVHVKDDSRRVANSYRDEGLNVPPRLTQKAGNVITARRYLSIAYGPDKFVRSFSEDDLRTRIGYVRGVGCDRAVLLGLFAWAWPTQGARARRVLLIVQQTWANAPVRSLAAGELHEELPPEALAAMRMDA